MKKILFVAGGILVAWGAYCWYKQDQKKGAQGATGTNGNGTTQPEKSSPAQLSSELTAGENRPQAEMVITDQPLEPAPLSDAVRYYDTNPAALYYRPRTTIAVGEQVAQDIITIDSANMYAR